MIVALLGAAAVLPTAALGQDHPQKRVGVLMPFPKEDETIQEELAAFA